MKWLSKKHVMVDIETLGTVANAVILSIGACKFDLKGLGVQEKFYVNVDINSCKELGLQVDPETVAWWKKQNPSVIKALKTPTPIPVIDALVYFSEWYGNTDYIWCRGMFDIPILEFAYKAAGMKPPYKYWSVLDHRTLSVILDNDFAKESLASDDYHNALGDAVRQAKNIITLFEKEPF